MVDPALRHEIRRLEFALARGDPTGVDGGLASLIADDFLEFGASGRTWTASDVREVIDGEPGPELDIEAFDVAELGPDVVLATYRTGPPRASNRSSLWVRREGRWLVRFHQGTLRPG
jgi:hypothetical protein